MSEHGGDELPVPGADPSSQVEVDHGRGTSVLLYVMAAVPVFLPAAIVLGWRLRRRSIGPEVAAHARNALFLGGLLASVLALHSMLHLGIIAVKALEARAVSDFGRSAALTPWQRETLGAASATNLILGVVEYSAGVVLMVWQASRAWVGRPAYRWSKARALHRDVRSRGHR